jgi:hypothetical protein
MPQREDGRLGTDGDIMAHPDLMAPTIEKAVEVDHIPVAQKYLPSVEKTAPHLHPGSATKTRKVATEIERPQRSRGQAADDTVVGKGENTSGKDSFIHDL